MGTIGTGLGSLTFDCVSEKVESVPKKADGVSKKADGVYKKADGVSKKKQDCETHTPVTIQAPGLRR